MLIVFWIDLKKARFKIKAKTLYLRSIRSFSKFDRASNFHLLQCKCNQVCTNQKSTALVLSPAGFYPLDF